MLGSVKKTIFKDFGRLLKAFISSPFLPFFPPLSKQLTREAVVTPRSLAVSHSVERHLGFPNTKCNQEGFRVTGESGKESGPGIFKQNICTRPECQPSSQVGRWAPQQAE